jgi:hypothetical protein
LFLAWTAGVDKVERDVLPPPPVVRLAVETPDNGTDERAGKEMKK